MSNYQPKPNNGSLWPNDKKTEEKHPDRTGSIMLECPHCKEQWEAFLDGWLKETDAGKKWLSVRVKTKTKQSAPQPAPSKTPATTTDF